MVQKIVIGVEDGFGGSNIATKKGIGNEKFGIVNDILNNIRISRNISYEDIVLNRENFIEQFGVEEYGLMLKEVFWGSKNKVPFEDFVEFLCIRNNFRNYFSAHGDFLFDFSYRNYGFYKRFAQNHSSLVQKLTKVYKKSQVSLYKETHKELELLYNAYELMIEDEEVLTNYQLFA